MRKQLTAAMVERQGAPATGRLEIFDAIVPSLALRVTATGAKSFVVRGRVRGELASIRFTLGDATVMKLTDARQAASDVLRAMRAGNDPRPPKAAPIARELTFGSLVDDWARLGIARRSRRYREDSPRAIRRNFPDLLEKPADSITKADTVNILDRIAHKPGEQDKARRCASACYGWALKRGKVAANPFAGLPDMSALAERERVLDAEEVRAIWVAAGTLPYPFGPFFKMAMLTLQRRETVAGMLWSELDLDKRLWAIPGTRMKQGKAHDVHLPSAAIDTLAAIPRLAGCDFVFTTTGRSSISGYSRAKEIIDREIARGRGEPLEPWWLHDLRRSGVTQLAAMGFDSIVVDKLLAHQPGKLRGVASIYQRHDFARERGQALDAWAALVTGVGADNVVPLVGRAAQ